jgi:hypothetical protein
MSFRAITPQTPSPLLPHNRNRLAQILRREFRKPLGRRVHSAGMDDVHAGLIEQFGDEFVCEDFHMSHVGRGARNFAAHELPEIFDVLNIRHGQRKFSLPAAIPAKFLRARAREKPNAPALRSRSRNQNSHSRTAARPCQCRYELCRPDLPRARARFPAKSVPVICTPFSFARVACGRNPLPVPMSSHFFG